MRWYHALPMDCHAAYSRGVLAMLLLLLVGAGTQQLPQRAYAAITITIVNSSNISITIYNAADGTISTVDDAEGSVS